MKTQTLKMVRTMLSGLFLACAAQAGSLNFDSTDPIKNSDGTLLDIGTYATVGHFGNRSASQVAALFSGATTASEVGTILSNNYFAIHAPVQSTAAGLLSYNEEVADNLGATGTSMPFWPDRPAGSMRSGFLRPTISRTVEANSAPPRKSSLITISRTSISSPSPSPSRWKMLGSPAPPRWQALAASVGGPSPYLP